MPINLDTSVSDEEYLILRAKESLKFDPYAAKSWMITAKTLFPHNFGIQFEAYLIEKSAKSLKEAAKCLSQIFQRFQDETGLWLEVEAITSALRSSSGGPDTVFFQDMFSHIPVDVQHEMLLQSAYRSEDTMEHCRLLLLLLRQFPATIPQHGPKLVDTLMTAEKHSHYQNAVNCYRKLLVCDLLPLLGTSHVELPPKQLFRLLQKSIEFYLAYLMLPNKSIPNLPELESKIEDPWKNLFAVQEMTGNKLKWELGTIFWNKELYWQKIVQFRADRPLTPDDFQNHKQLLYCLTTFFLYCLHDYVGAQDPGGGEPSLILVEAFCSSSEPENLGEQKVKRRKMEFDDGNVPFLSVAKKADGSISTVVHNFLMAVRCWDLLYSTDSLEREFGRLALHLKLDLWLQGFLVDAALYNGNFTNALTLIKNQEAVGNAAVTKHLRLASTYYCLAQHQATVEHILLVVGALHTLSNSGLISSNINILDQVSRSGRHMYFLGQSRSQVLQYCVKLLLAALKKCLVKIETDPDLVIGHMIVLLQFDWPLEEELFNNLVDKIRQKGAFSYTLFQNYVITVDILEEFMYLSTEQGGAVPLDIMPAAQLISQRRISTRGADKGVKEDFKLAMRRQVARSGEPLDQLIIKFLTSERELLLQSLQ